METALYAISFSAALAAAGVLSFTAGRRARSGEDFSLSGRTLGTAGVSWVIIGTLVGGAATIGTVQTAYVGGFSAWYFTLGSGLACLVLGLLFSRALRESGTVTVAEFLGTCFGPAFRTYASLLSSLGMLMQVVAQFLAATAILKAVFGLGTGASIAVVFLVTAGFVVSGGMAGAGRIGRLKFQLLCLILVLSAGLCWYRAGGFGALFAALRAQGATVGFLAEGPLAAVVDILSMVVGVLSTQIYLQAVFSARSVREARNGALLSAALIPPMGLLGIVIGLYLRASAPELDGRTALALPYFLTTAYPPVVAALFTAGLFIIVVGTGSGLVLGVATNLYVDFLMRVSGFARRWPGTLLVRASCLGVLAVTVGLVWLGLDATILKWSYLSMGLRGTAVFAGLCLAVFAGCGRRVAAARPLLFLLPVVYLAVVWIRHTG